MSMIDKTMGWHAPPLRRVAFGAAVGIVVGLAIGRVDTWDVALLAGWDAGELAFLGAVWFTINGCDPADTMHLAMREDPNRDLARFLVVGASVASLVAVGVALGRASHLSGDERTALIVLAGITVVLSWTVVNTIFLLRYADLYYAGPPDAIDFGDSQPDFRDFAYLAFTIGMTYQISDTTLRDPRMRRAVLGHAVLSYGFGVVIVGGTVSAIVGLVS
jgi:uncharacterized membrane protein